ncbi:hypothetical protein RFI_26218, partial [Reticulomyxa filosa]
FLKKKKKKKKKKKRASQTLTKATTVLDENMIGECIAELQTRKLSLINTVQNTKLNKKKNYELQMKKFHSSHQAIIQVKESCEERLSNPSLDSSSRSLYISKEIRGIVSKDMELDLATQPDVKMLCNGNLFTE